MKYKADYSKKMTFHQVLSSFNSDKKYISYSTQKNIDKEKLFESRIISFNIFGEIFIDGKHDDTGRYQELIKLDWFEVHEVKEEPIIPEGNHINKKAVEGFKDSLDSLNNGKTVDIVRSVIAQKLNYLEKLQAKEFRLERQILIEKAKKALRRNRSYSMQNQVKKPKKPKQEFDGDESIYISDSGKKMFRACDMDAQAQSIFYQIATQADINKFFKGTKKRKQYIYCKEEEKGTLSGKIYNVKYYKTLDIKDKGIEITEKEYLEGLK